MKYDFCLMNPPFSEASDASFRVALWPKFIKTAMDNLKEGGTLTCVCPTTWMNKAKGGAWKTISQYDLVMVSPNVKEYFPGTGGHGCTFSTITLKKQPYSGKTLIDGKFEIDFHNNVIPANNKMITENNMKILDELLKRKLDLDVLSGPKNPSINSDSYSDKKTRRHQYETYYSGASHRRSIWCDEPIGHYGDWKLIVACCGSFYKTMEITDKGVGRQSNYVLGTKKELKRIKKLLLSDDSRVLCELMMEGNYNNALEYIVDI